MTTGEAVALTWTLDSLDPRIGAAVVVRDGKQFTNARVMVNNRGSAFLYLDGNFRTWSERITGVLTPAQDGPSGWPDRDGEWFVVQGTDESGAGVTYKFKVDNPQQGGCVPCGHG